MSETKDSASILDATAGNRRMWNVKEDSRILWIDIEPELEFKPDRILDCTNTGFEDSRFNLIIFDPPHKFGEKRNTGIFSTPRSTEKYKEWAPTNRIPVYYGADKYKTKDDLLSFIFKAEKEFHRILNTDGVLFIKWSEVSISLEDFLKIFLKWKVMIKIPIGSNRKNHSKGYWLLLMKKIGNSITAISKNTVKFIQETSLEKF